MNGFWSWILVSLFVGCGGEPAVELCDVDGDGVDGYACGGTDCDDTDKLTFQAPMSPVMGLTTTVMVGYIVTRWMARLCMSMRTVMAMVIRSRGSWRVSRAGQMSGMRTVQRHRRND